VIVGEEADDGTQALLRKVHSLYLPNKVLILCDTSKYTFLATRHKLLTSLQKKGGQATAYVCQNFTCSLPVTSEEELEKLVLQESM